jgi:PBP1b-binding outer membrane lipoprotein LpoB
MKKLILVLGFALLLTACTKEAEQPEKEEPTVVAPTEPEVPAEPTPLDTHDKLVDDYDDLEEGHVFVEYSGDHINELINEDNKVVLFIGRPT